MPETKLRRRPGYSLFPRTRLNPPSRELVRDTNKLRDEDRAVHDWYRFVLSFPPHLVRTYLEKFGAGGKCTVLDPFCGTGTTLVECKKVGIRSAGIEANPIAAFASNVKVDWGVNPQKLLETASKIAEAVGNKLRAQGIGDGTPPLFRPARKANAELETLPIPAMSLLLKDSVSPLPLHKTITLLREIERHENDRLRAYFRLALASALVTQIGNLHFGPEVGISAPKADAPVVDPWLQNVQRMADDISQLARRKHAPATVYQADARNPATVIPPESIDVVITSPPYPNEKDYSRITRLESVILGFVKDKSDLRSLKQKLIRSNTRGVYKYDGEDNLVAENAEIQRIAKAIEARRLELNKDSGFERLYARVTKLYFGGMYQHLSALRGFLRPGARLAYVVGDQASYLRVMIRTGQILSELAESLGYQILGIDLFRTRLATATKEQLREEVLLLRWP